MKSLTVITFFSFLTVSFADECGECQDIKVPLFGTLEYYKFIQGTYYTTGFQTDQKARTVKLNIQDARGVPLEMARPEDFKEKLKSTETVKIETIEFPTNDVSEKALLIRYMGVNRWGIKTFQFDIYRTFKVPKKEDLPKKKKITPSREQMLATTPPERDFYCKLRNLTGSATRMEGVK